MKRKITELIIILFFYIMQVSAARVISIANISPNWLIIMPVFFGFFCAAYRRTGVSNSGM